MSMFNVIQHMNTLKNNKRGQLAVVGLVVGLMVAAILIAILGLQVGYPIVLAASNTTCAVNASQAVCAASATDRSIVTYIPTLYLISLLMVVVGLIVGAVFVGYSKFK